MVSCKTTSGTDHDQIVKSSIDLANQYISTGQYEKALSVYDRALSQADDYKLLYNKVLTLSFMGEYEKAQMLCQESFNRYNYILSFKKTQALLLCELGRTNEAFDCYIAVLEKDPYDTETRRALIDFLIENNLEDKAYEQALILWNQGYKTKENCQILFDLNPAEWNSVFATFN